MYAFMVECWHEIPGRRPGFAEIAGRLRQWEGGPVLGGYQPSLTSHSLGNTSQQSGSTQHSSTGPSNNTGSTQLTQQYQYSGPHIYPGHQHQTVLVGGAGGGAQFPSHHLYPGPQHQPGQHYQPTMSHSQPGSHCATPSIASLQMV